MRLSGRVIQLGRRTRLVAGVVIVLCLVRIAAMATESTSQTVLGLMCMFLGGTTIKTARPAARAAARRTEDSVDWFGFGTGSSAYTSVLYRRVAVGAILIIFGGLTALDLLP
jgi:hypothetical protein